MVVESRSRRLSINASLSLLSGFQLWRYVSCSVCRRFLLNTLTCALDPGAYFLSESSVLPPSFLAACFRVNLCPQLLDRILFPILSMCIQSAAPTIQGCRCHWGSRPPPRNGRGCSLFLVTNTFALHHVTIRFGSLPLHVFRSLYLVVLSNVLPVSATLSHNSSANIVHHDPYGYHDL